MLCISGAQRPPEQRREASETVCFRSAGASLETGEFACAARQQDTDDWRDSLNRHIVTSAFTIQRVHLNDLTSQE